MIELKYKRYFFVCDRCKSESRARFRTHNEAVENKKHLGWKSVKDNEGWADVCPDCQVKKIGGKGYS